MPSNVIQNHQYFLRRSLFLLLLIMISPVNSRLPKGTEEKKLYQNDYRSTQKSRLLNTTICKDRCFSDCINYLTPIGICYNGNSNLNRQNENSDPFGENDIWDDPIVLDGTTHVIGIERKFYKSTNSSCTGGVTDMFDKLPLNKCIGPFGPPRPWGILALAPEGLFQMSGGQTSM